MRDDGNIHERQQSKSMVGPIIVVFLLIIAISYMLPGSKLPSFITNGSQFSSLHQAPGQQSSSNGRIDQTDRAQYASDQEYSTWYLSSCSAAAMAYVLNSLGGHYIIHDVLQAEISTGQISSYSGLLYGFDSVAKTVSQLGYHANSVVGGIDGIVGMANGGNPVIVDMHNADWPSGHILVVVGGDTTNLQVVDSWTTNKTSISRTDFSTQWTGLAASIAKGGAQ
jgi:hypothetical protein